MAVVNCHACRKRYSSVQKRCPHCDADPATAPRHRKPVGAGPNTHLLLGMVAAIGGTGWYYSAVATGRDPTQAKLMIGLGLVWYIGARIWSAMRGRE
ncbi:MAG: hypothetical protein OEQ74_04250 [Gammaproteobacteria bacterium]|nr:hypothetical protein [Gammaproteobacteria bacterium]